MWLEALMSDAKISCPLRHFFLTALEHSESMCGRFDKKKPASPEKRLRPGKIFFLLFLGKCAGFMVKHVFLHWKINAQDVKNSSCLRVLYVVCTIGWFLLILFHICVCNETKKSCHPPSPGPPKIQDQLIHCNTY